MNGYVAKLQFRQRTKHTLLVEGPSDKIVLSSLILSCPRSQLLPPVHIDTAEMVKAPKLGNRERVEQVHTVANQLGVQGYACVVDREFREFLCSAPYTDNIADHRVQDDVLFWTRGHSVENYMFVIETVLHYLEIAHASSLQANTYKSIVTQAYLPIMQQAVAFSLAAYACEQISRVDGILEVSTWSLNAAGLPELNIQKVGLTLGKRSATTDQIQKFESAYVDHLVAVRQHPLSQLRWMNHGHLGSQALWSGIAVLFQNQGFDPKALDQLCRGQNDFKRQLGANLWASRCRSTKSSDEVPYKLMEWLAGTSPNLHVP